LWNLKSQRIKKRTEGNNKTLFRVHRNDCSEGGEEIGKTDSDQRYICQRDTGLKGKSHRGGGGPGRRGCCRQSFCPVRCIHRNVRGGGTPGRGKAVRRKRGRAGGGKCKQPDRPHRDRD